MSATSPSSARPSAPRRPSPLQRRNPDIGAVVSNLAGRAYHGFDGITPAARIGTRPFLIIAAADEPSASTAASTLERIVPGARVALVPHSAAHGVALLAASPRTETRLVRFLRSLPTPPPL